MAELGAYYITIMPSMKGFSSAVNKELGGLGSAGGKQYSGGFMDVLKGSAVGTVLGNLATKAGSSIMSGLRTGIGRLDTIQNFPKVMESLGYSTDEADKSIHTIMDHLDGLPTSTQDMVTLTQAISDSTGDLGLATKAALGFNDMMLANGASSAEMATAQGVLNRVLGKGSATVAQWQSLTSVMPAQLGAVARKMLGAGASTEDLHEALENGTVSWKDFLQAVVDLDEKGEGAMASFYEQAKANSHGIGTALENIPNRIGAGWAAILESLGREEIAGVIDKLSYGVRDAMKGIADAITDVKERLSETAAFENIATIVAALKEHFEGFGNAISGAVANATPIIADLIDRGLQWLVDHGEQIGGFVDGIGEAFRIFGEHIGNAIGTVTPVLQDIISGALDWFMANGEAISGFVQDIADVFGYWAEIIAGVFADAAPVVADFVSDVAQWFLDHSDALTGFLKDIADAFKKVADKLSGPFKDGMDKLSDATTGALQWLYDNADGVGTGLAAVASGLAGIAAAQTAVTVLNGVKGALAAISAVLPFLSLLKGPTIAATIGNIAAQLGILAGSGGPLAGIAGTLATILGGIASTPVLIAGAIAAVVGGLIYFFGFTEKGKQMWSDLCTGLKEDWDNFCATVSQNIETQKEVWANFKTNLAEWNESVRENFAQKWEEIKTGVSEKWTALKDDVAAKREEWATQTAEWNENMRAGFAEKWEGIKTTVSEKWSSLKDDVAAKREEWATQTAEWNENMRQGFATKWQEIKDSVSSKVSELKDSATTKFEELRSTVSTKWAEISSNTSQKWSEIKSSVSEKASAIRESIQDRLSSARDAALDIFEGIKDGITSKIEWARDRIADIIEGIKGLFNFSWSLPAPQLPHIAWDWQDVGGLVSIPYFYIDWYAKGGVFDAATIIGIGEKGREAALPLNSKTYGEIAKGISNEMGTRQVAPNITVTGNTFVIREEADIDRIADALSVRWTRQMGAAL